ncbi:MAG: IS5/IS1182 family transposase, partial [SAR202 cluster bacterium]|nr:IS5/IS1182 family transposase [SAR202 cluster bacterium]MBM3934668.1 IS5/IS1182 family transposase [SAR202 cluster bacterium]MBM3934963.1 IS5/IS1182 family transposase [SAR202 cluster bacterium]MBM3935184.1 IS5/IS1182 family transposase [SAR202 cluster bacterium]MBM3935261.1 IS5/IS1182 family transposase [SAR202 cluster bacterium]
MHRNMGNPSMIEAFLPEQVGRNERLERIAQVVDWEKMGKLVSDI